MSWVHSLLPNDIGVDDADSPVIAKFAAGGLFVAIAQYHTPTPRGRGCRSCEGDRAGTKCDPWRQGRSATRKRDATGRPMDWLSFTRTWGEARVKPHYGVHRSRHVKSEGATMRNIAR
jgi:hypothetical protein